MNRRVRRSLLFLALLAFVVVTPAIILYALGFRPQARVGVLVTESIPSRAQVFVDGKLRGTTPQTISGMGGDVFQLRVERENYRAWDKRLALESGITEVHNIRLIPKTLTPQPIVENAAHVSLAPNRRFIAAVKQDKQLIIIDEAGSTVVSDVTLPNVPRALLWSPDSTLLLLTYPQGQQSIVRLSDSLLQQVSPVTAPSPASIAWDPHLPGRLFMLSPGGTLLAYDTGSNTQRALGANITVFAPSSREIIVVTGDQTLKRLTLFGQPTGAAPQPLPQPVQRLVVAPGGQVTLQFQDGSASLITADGLTSLAHSVVSLGFSPSGRMLYLQTSSSELSIYNQSETSLTYLPVQKTQLIVRVSQPLTHPQWFAGGEHLIYQLGDQIILIEIDTRDHAISEVIDSTNLSDAEVTVTEDGEALLYLKRDARGTNLVRTSLLVP